MKKIIIIFFLQITSCSHNTTNSIEGSWIRQGTIEYKNGKPSAVKSVVISTQHSKDVNLAKVKELCMPYIEKSIPKNLLGSLDEKDVNETIGSIEGKEMARDAMAQPAITASVSSYKFLRKTIKNLK